MMLCTFYDSKMALNCRFSIICILAGILQFPWITAFEKPCDMSPNTVEIVDQCPKDKEAFEERAVQKNCSAINSTCDNFVYHCVINGYRNATIEVCATRLWIIGHVCGEYSSFFKSIRSSERSCKNFTVSCPYKYKSTEQYKVPGCYEFINKTSRTGLPPRKMETPGFLVGEVIGIVLAALIGVLLVAFIIFVKRKMRKEHKTCKEVFSTFPICGLYFTEVGVNKARRGGDIHESFSSDRLLSPDKIDNEILEHENKISEKEVSSNKVCDIQKVDDIVASAKVSEPEQQVGGASSLELKQMENSTSFIPSNQTSETALNQIACTTMTMQTNTTSNAPCNSSIQDIQSNQSPLPSSDEQPSPSSTSRQLVPRQQEELDQPIVPTDTKQSFENSNASLLDSISPSQMSYIPQNYLSDVSSNPQTEQSSATTSHIQNTASLKNEQKDQPFQSSQYQQMESCLSTTQIQVTDSGDGADDQQFSKSSHLLKQEENHSLSSSLNQQASLHVSTQSNQPFSLNCPSLQSSDDKSTNKEKGPTVSKTSNSRSPSPTSKTLCNDAQDGRYAQPERPDAPSEKAFGGSIHAIKLGKSELEPSTNTPVKSRYQGFGGAHDKVYKNKMNRDDKGTHQTDLRSKSGAEVNFDDPVDTVNSLAEEIAPIGRTIPSRFQDQINEQSDQPSLEELFNKRFDRLEKTFTCTIESLTQEFHRAEERFRLATEELRLALQKIEDLEKRLTENKNEITRLSSLLDDRNSQLNERDRELERKDTEIRELERQLDQRRRENERMQREKEAQQRKSSELKRENERLEREKNELKAEIEKSGKKNKK